MRTNIYLAIIIVGHFLTAGLPAFAESDPGLSCPKLLESDFEYAQSRDLTFKSVEVFRRNNDIGIQQVGSITFKQWIDLPSTDPNIFNYVGLTENGDIFHLVHYGQRVVARLLSGHKTYTEIVLIQGKVLAAVDRLDRVWLYSAAKWNQSPRNNVIRSALIHWASISGTLFGVVANAAPDVLSFGPNVSGLTISIPLSTIAIGSALSSGLLALIQYDRMNTYPDGFVETTKTLSDLKGSDLLFREFDSAYAGFKFEELPAVIPEAQEPIRR